MNALLICTGFVALAEMGDKTQLLAFLLAARFKKPAPIIAGIFVATILNHALAGAVGHWVATAVPPQVMRWVLGLAFIAMAVWTLIPDKLDEDEAQVSQNRFGVFGATLVTFFLAEMGDKTQIATIGLAARFQEAPVMVVMGTTLGMMLANVPAVYLGKTFAARINMRLVHGIAAAIFAVLGVATLLGLGERFGL
jgi:putative Ca2+/H+ antiporter (TMEM165/GDT1 family)